MLAAQTLFDSSVKELTLDELDAISGGCVGNCGNRCGNCPPVIVLSNCSKVWYDSHGSENQTCHSQLKQ
jgi:bacteriocin-like protein